MGLWISCEPAYIGVRNQWLGGACLSRSEVENIRFLFEEVQGTMSLKHGPKWTRAGMPISMNRLLDVFWVLGATVLLMGLGALWLTQRQEARLLNYTMPYRFVVSDVRTDLYAYDGALNMYAGLPQDPALQHQTLATIQQEQRNMSQDLIAARQTAPTPALHQQALAVARRWGAYQRDAAAVLHLLAIGQTAQAQHAQYVGNVGVTNALIAASRRLDAGDAQYMDTLIRAERTRGAGILVAMMGFMLIIGATALSLRARVHRGVAGLADALGQLTQGNLSITTPAPPSAPLAEFQMLDHAVARVNEQIQVALSERDQVIAAQEDAIQERTAERAAYGMALEQVLAMTERGMRDWLAPPDATEVLRELATVLGADGVSVWLPDPWRETTRVGRLPWAAGDPLPLALQEKGMAPSRAARWPSAIASESDRNVLALPWRTYRSARQLLVLVRPADVEWTPSDRRLATIASTQIQLMIDNTALFKDIRHRAITDPLTGLFNRWQLWEDLSAGSIGARMILLFDLDYLKRLNDSRGHAAGDRALCEVGDALRTAAGEAGRVYRIGGDEFAVIVPGSDPAIGIAVYQAAARTLTPTLSLSAGLAVETEKVSGEVLMRHADDALYRAKEGGRGQVRVADPWDA